mmetsp:Transcript_25641/g.66274  ORF Transcript_25641/g.66274 Transcript_25641/m.66274 type:complete len:202 (+) Transcript_25641:240-845(+)
MRFRRCISFSIRVCSSVSLKSRSSTDLRSSASASMSCCSAVSSSFDSQPLPPVSYRLRTRSAFDQYRHVGKRSEGYARPEARRISRSSLSVTMPSASACFISRCVLRERSAITRNLYCFCVSCTMMLTVYLIVLYSFLLCGSSLSSFFALAYERVTMATNILRRMNMTKIAYMIKSTGPRSRLAWRSSSRFTSPDSTPNSV